jgi:hypothetical protein
MSLNLTAPPAPCYTEIPAAAKGVGGNGPGQVPGLETRF